MGRDGAGRYIPVLPPLRRGSVVDFLLKICGKIRKKHKKICANAEISLELKLFHDLLFFIYFLKAS